MSTTDTTRTYYFGPLERRRFFLGLSKPTTVLALVGLFVCIAVMMAGASGLGLLLGLLVVSAAALTLLPIGSRNLGEWAPVIAGHLIRRADGTTRWRSATPTNGATVADPAEALDMPPGLEGVRVVAVDDGTGEVGMLLDGDRPVGVLTVTGRAFALLDGHEQDRLVSGWGEFLAACAEHGSTLERVQWVDVSGPSDTGLLTAYAEREAAPLNDAAAASYHELVSGQQVTQARDSVFVFRWNPARMRRQAKAHGGGQTGALTVARQQLAHMADRLRRAGFTVGAPPAPRELARLLRVAADPAERQASATRAALGLDAGVAPEAAWPLAADEGWTTHRTDSAHHRTMWAEELPRRDQRADWLVPLLAWTPDGLAGRAVAAVFEPMDRLASIREVERANVSDEADLGFRARFGFRTTRRRERETEQLTAREDELSHGAAVVRASVYVTVSAPEAEALEQVQADAQIAAAEANIRLRSLVGQQDIAWTYTLPLARGLA